jgi:hypothetical protein
VNLIERCVGDATSPLTIEEMGDELCSQYERLMNNSSGGSDIEVKEEQALYTGHQFKGKCYICGKIGHKGANCRERANKQNACFQGRGGRGMGFQQVMNSGRDFKGNCNYCHKFGHKVADCIKRKNDLESRGDGNGGLRHRQDIADVSMIAHKMEFALNNGSLVIVSTMEVEVHLGHFVIDVLIRDASMHQYGDEGGNEYENDTEDKEVNENYITEEKKYESNDDNEDSTFDNEFEKTSF